MARRTQSSAASGCIILVCFVLAMLGGVVSCVSGTTGSGTGTTSTTDYDPTDPGADLPPADSGTGSDDGSDGGSVDLPGHGYVTGPGVDCSVHGCHGHLLPHFGWHF